MLILKEISKSYQSTPVLTGISLNCVPGTALCLIGANAAGKTTLLTIAAGLQKADSGSVQSSGTIGFVPQESALLEDLSVRENLMLWYAACGRPRRAIFSENAVETKLGLLPFAKKTVKKLSGGYCKRVNIACALVKNPDYLLMDEPFNALDLASRIEIAALIAELCVAGKGVLFSSHDPDAIARAAKEIAVLQNGVITRQESIPSTPERETRILHLLSQIQQPLIF